MKRFLFLCLVLSLSIFACSKTNVNVEKNEEIPAEESISSSEIDVIDVNTENQIINEESNVQVNKEMYVKENLRLKTEGTTSSSVIDVMGVGTKVNIIELGNQEVIDNIKSNWVKIQVLDGKTKDGEILTNGTIGWCFGGFLTDSIEENESLDLADKVGPYDHFDISDNNYLLNKPTFNNELDEQVWEKLAGYYFVSEPRDTMPDFEEIDTPWGKDYKFTGRGTHFFAYENGVWCHGGDGEYTEFEILSISEDGTEFSIKEKYFDDPRIWKFDGAYFSDEIRTYYKYTGPDCYKSFLREFIANYNETQAQIQEATANIDLSQVEPISKEILKALSNGDIKTYSMYAPKDFPVNLRIGDYRENQVFSYEDLLNETDDVKKAFEFMKNDLKFHKPVLESIVPYINEFRDTTLERMQENFPEATVIVEYILREGKYDNESVRFYFKEENGSMIFVGVEEYACFRA